MSGIATTEQGFIEFGPSFLHQSVFGKTDGLELVSDRKDFRRLLHEQSPALPGVYGWIGPDQRLVYVGKSKSLRHRLLSYFAATPADPKMARIRNASLRIVWQPVGHELLALLREQELIHRWRPEFNSQGQPNRRLPAYVAISESAAPHAMVVKRLSGRCQNAFGPITGTGDLAESVTALNHVFQLRDCADKTGFQFGDQMQLFDEIGDRAQCLRHELGSCPAPCASFCTRDQYLSRVERAINFLKGNDRETVRDLENRMIVAAANLQYERAAIYCNQWQSLDRLSRQLHRIRTTERTIHGVMQIRLSPKRTFCLVFSRGALVDGIPLPRSPDRCRDLASQLMRMKTNPALASDDTLSLNLRLIVGTWFRKNREIVSQIVALDTAAEQLMERFSVSRNVELI